MSNPEKFGGLTPDKRKRLYQCTSGVSRDHIRSLEGSAFELQGARMNRSATKDPSARSSVRVRHRGAMLARRWVATGVSAQSAASTVVLIGLDGFHPSYRRVGYRENPDPYFLTYGPKTRREFLNLLSWKGGKLGD